MSKPFQWIRNQPLLQGCPKSFHFGDYVETNDRSVAGFVRGVMNPGPSADQGFYLIQVHEDGDVIPLHNRTLQLVLRTNTLDAMTAAYESYIREKL